MDDDNRYQKIQRIYRDIRTADNPGNPTDSQNTAEKDNKNYKLNRKIQHRNRIRHIEYARRIRQSFQDLLSQYIYQGPGTRDF